MNIEGALKTAIEYEMCVRDVYADALNRIIDEKGKVFFSTMVDEEQGHVNYLNSKLEEWHKNGSILDSVLETAIPSVKIIRESVKGLKAEISEIDVNNELQYLCRALDVEIKTSDFYSKLFEEITDEGNALFKRFMEIEKGHVEIVKAEMEYLMRAGYWFDFFEADLNGV